MVIKGLLLLCFVVLTNGCTALPSIEGRTPSYTQTNLHNTQLSRLVNQKLIPHQDQSGVVLVNSGQDAFSSRIALTDAAERTIDAQYYIWNSDLTGRLLAERLLDAANRGVRVRLLLDDFGLGAGEKDNALIALAAHPKIELRVYNPLHTGLRNGLRKVFGLIVGSARLNRRMHSKTYIVDGSFSIVGGRNIGDEYFDASQQMNYRDRELLVVGPVVVDISKQFDVMWNSQWSFPIASLLKSSSTPEEIQKKYHDLHEFTETDREQFYALPANATERLKLFNSWLDKSTWAITEFVYNPPEITGGDEVKGAVFTEFLMKQLDSVDKEILVESAYFILSDEFIKQLDPLLNNDIKIKVLTNSLITTDLWTIHAGYTRNRKDIIKRGIELYEFRPDAASCQQLMENRQLNCTDFKFSLHSKSVVFDRKVVLVGSFNLNPRSRYLNTETGLIVHSPKLAEQIARDIEENMKPENSWQVLLNEDGELNWHARTQGQVSIETHEPDTGIWLRLKTFLFSWLPVEKYL